MKSCVRHTSTTPASPLSIMYCPSRLRVCDCTHAKGSVNTQLDTQRGVSICNWTHTGKCQYATGRTKVSVNTQLDTQRRVSIRNWTQSSCQVLTLTVTSRCFMLQGPSFHSSCTQLSPLFLSGCELPLNSICTSEHFCDKLLIYSL